MEVAGANRRWRLQFRCRGSRRESAVAQLFSLGSVRTLMKIFLWLSTLALAVVSFSCWAMSGLIMKSLADTGRGPYLPAFTVFLFRPNGWILLCSFPWIVYSAVLSFRREVTPRAVFIFAGTILLGTALLVCAFFIASVLPFLRMKV
jgi:hypothetical protein